MRSEPTATRIRFPLTGPQVTVPRWLDKDRLSVCLICCFGEASSGFEIPELRFQAVVQPNRFAHVPVENSAIKMSTVGPALGAQCKVTRHEYTGASVTGTSGRPPIEHSGTTFALDIGFDALFGRWAMGRCTRAPGMMTGSSCAVKLLQVDGAVRAACAYPFSRTKPRMAAKSSIPMSSRFSIIKGGTRWLTLLVMELLRGATLMHFLKSEVRLTIEQTIEIVTKIGSALHAVPGRNRSSRHQTTQYFLLIDRRAT